MRQVYKSFQLAAARVRWCDV